MSKKTISILLAMTLLTGISAGATREVFATTINENKVDKALETTDVELVYKRAYDLTMTACEVRTQEAVTEARHAIWKLPQPSYNWAIGTFSSMLDDVQLELFRTFLNIFHDKNGVQVKSLTQDQINEGREMLEGFYTWENNRQYCYTWSSCMDNYQLQIMKQVDEALKKAKETKTTTDIQNSRKLVNIVLGVKYNDGVLNWAKVIDTELKLIENAPEENKKMFQDDNLEKAIRTLINKPSGEIKSTDVENIKTLELKGLGIKDLTGLEHFKSLTSLELSVVPTYDEEGNYVLKQNYVEDLSPLRNLVSLEYLDVAGNNIKDVSSLSELTNLNLLGLDNNPITDISMLGKTVKNIERLYLNNLDLTDLSVLKNAENTKILGLVGFNNYNDSNLGAIKNIKTLKQLTLDRNVDDSVVNAIKEALPSCEVRKR